MQGKIQTTAFMMTSKIEKINAKTRNANNSWIVVDILFHQQNKHSRPRWLSWMHRPTGDQVAGSTPAEVGNILSWRLIMKYFLRSFSPFR